MASREQNEAVAGLLRQSLAQGAAPDACPDAELLAAYFERTLAEDEVSRFDRHLSACSRCRAQLAAMVRAEVPKLPPKTFWLLDWRLLSATALVMVVATVVFLRRPSPMAPVAQIVGSPAAPAVTVPQADSSTALTIEPESTKESPSSSAAERLKKNAAPERFTAPRINVATQPAEGKVTTPNTLKGTASPAGNSGTDQGSRGASVHTEPAGPATPQPRATGGGQGGGFGPKSTASSAASGASLQQIPPASEMVLVQPGPPPRPSASSPSSKAAQDKAKEQSGASAGVAGGEPANAPVTAQSETVPSSKKTDKLVTAYAANETSTQMQTVEERSQEKVIDTPIAAIKWRITAAGFVERSEDGGATWTGQEPDPEAHLIAGSAPTDKVCWLVGKEGVVLVTKDATNWKKIPPPAATDITSVSANSASDATVTTSDGRRFTTHNEGKKWKPAKVN